MTKLEFWLMDVVIDCWTPLFMLLDPHLEELFNRSGHGQTPDGLARALEDLHERTVIAGRRGQRSVPLTRAAIAEGLSQKRGGNQLLTHFGLTATGGTAWETATEADWNLYVLALTCVAPNKGWIEAATLDLAEAEFRQGEPGQEVVARSRRDAALTPWQATYWKVLPTGHRITYRWKEVRPTPNELPRVPAGRRWYRQPEL